MEQRRSLMTLSAVTLDCDDPVALAAFYEQATGLEPVDGSGEDFAGLRGAGGVFVVFQRVHGYRAPRWPGQDEAQQLHLDFEVDDLDLAEGALLKLGAEKPTDQPDPARWRVLLDPAGHPFCVTASRRVRTDEGSITTTV
jgi:catechol 2,3-dioxygenase-like lactoylglutathione lyase family enzyme